ncbi:MAG TPA: molybdopterin-dependent oxidoreductase, partial [Bacteroidales bacterium]|nr:molybdopterin-dependent oxidoreductase [Bacteroidales bacterium]
RVYHIPRFVNVLSANYLADGTAILECNYQDFGQGGRTSQVQLAAETLGIPYDKVIIVSGDSNLPYTHIQTCSSGTLVQGFATHNAAVDAKNNLLKRATRMLEVEDPAELDTADGFVFARANPAVRLPWIAVFARIGILGATQEIIGLGWNRVGAGAMSGEQGATFVDLDVDTETGQLCNIKVTHAQDCGKAIFPKAVEGDWLGIHHGVEAVVGVTQVLDPKTGKLLNDNWIDYPVATMLDSEVEPLIVEVFDPTHPYGAAGIAQSHQNGLAAAMSNAIYNAIGVRMKETPFTPDKILAALGKI